MMGRTKGETMTKRMKVAVLMAPSPRWGMNATSAGTVEVVVVIAVLIASSPRWGMDATSTGEYTATYNDTVLL